MGGNGGVGNACGGGSHQNFRLRVLPLHGIGNGLLHLVPGFRSGEDQPVIAVDRALDAAGPGKGLLRAEKDRLDLQQTLGNAHIDAVHSLFSFISIFCRSNRFRFAAQPTNSATQRR